MDMIIVGSLGGITLLVVGAFFDRKARGYLNRSRPKKVDRPEVCDCGRSNATGSKFCGHCGGRIKSPVDKWRSAAEDLAHLQATLRDKSHLFRCCPVELCNDEHTLAQMDVHRDDRWATVIADTREGIVTRYKVAYLLRDSGGRTSPYEEMFDSDEDLADWLHNFL